MIKTREEKAHLLCLLLPDPDAVAETCCLMLATISCEHREAKRHNRWQKKDQLEEPKALGTPAVPLDWHLNYLSPDLLVKNQCLYGLPLFIV